MEGVVTSVEVEGVRDRNSCKQMSHPLLLLLLL